MRKYKLLIIPNSLSMFGGGEHLAFDMAKKLKGMCDVSLLNPISKRDEQRRDKASLLREYGMLEDQIVDVQCSSFNLRLFKTEDVIFMVPKPAGLRRLADAIRKTDSIYCITHNPLLLAYAVFFANVYKKKFVFAIQNRIFGSIFESTPGLLTKSGAVVYRQVLKQIRYFHSLNSYDTGIVKKRIPKARVYQIPGFAEFKDQKAKVNQKKFTALFVGRLPRYQKGVDLFCEVAEKVARREPGIEFRIAGAGGDGEPLVKRLAEKYPDSVKWLGFLPYEKVKEQYKTASLLAFTARGDELRYFPLVFLEAQSFGIPIVTFDGDGYRGIVTDGVEGALVKKFDTERFAEQVIGYYRMWKGSKARYQSLMRRVSSLTKKKFGDGVIIPKMGRAFRP